MNNFEINPTPLPESIAATYGEMRSLGERPAVALASLILSGAESASVLRAAATAGEPLPDLYVAMRQLGHSPDQTLTFVLR